MDQRNSTNIKVAIRIRPFLQAEHEKKLCAHWATQNNVIYQVTDGGHKFGDCYSFDHIFENKTNGEIYTDVVKEFVNSSIDGLNSTIFAYGQTSSGKTYTMLGDKKDTGIMTLAVEHIFESIESNPCRKYLIRVSYLEIYNEKINDLLDPNNKDLKIREYPPATIGLQNIKEELVSTREQMYDCLKRGNLNRHIGSTQANVRSSRSHTIFKIMIESTQVSDFDSSSGGLQVSNLNLVDLAGSERVAQTKATGMRLKEGGHINKSLSALGLVIKQLSDGQEYVNFRDSKLTRLLQDSIGGNSKTLIIATITLASIEDTASTLAFAQRAKTVKNKPHVNEILTDADVSKRYASLNSRLQKKLEEQMRINQKLRVTQEENEREMTRLQQQMVMLDDFQGCSSPASNPIPTRRHTIGFSTHKSSNPRILWRDFDKSSQFLAETSLEIARRESTTAVPMLEQILEDEPLTLSPTPTENIETTPPSRLRIRLSALEQEYNELLTFTRDEDNIMNETSHELEAVREQLFRSQAENRELKQQLQQADKELMERHSDEELAKFWENKYKIREQELCSRIAELQTTPHQPHTEEHDSTFYIEECRDIKTLLISLQDALRSPDFKQSDEKKEHDSVLGIIEQFNAKVKTSKNIIESEILRQISDFDGSKDHIFKTEQVNFNDLLNELSLFESDVPVDVINSMKKGSIEDCKILIKIYDFLLRKNEFTRQCCDKIRALDEEMTLTMRRYEEEKESFLERIRELEETLQIQVRDLDSVTSDLMDKGELCTRLNDEKGQLEKRISEAEISRDCLKKENELLKLQIEDLKTGQEKELEDSEKTLKGKINELTAEVERSQQARTLLEALKDQASDSERLKDQNEELLSEKEKNTQLLLESQQACSNLTQEVTLLKSESSNLVQSLQHCADGLKDQIELMSIEIAEKQRMIENLKVENIQTKEENAELKNKMEGLLVKTAVESTVTNLKNEIATKENIISESQTKIEHLKEESNQAKEEIKQLKNKIDELQTEMGRKTTLLQTLKMESSEKDQHIQDLKDQINKMSIQITVKESLINKAQSDIELLKEESIQAKEETKNQKNRINELLSEVQINEELLSESRQAQTELEKELAICKSESSDLVRKNQSLEDNISNLEGQIERISMEIAEKDRKNECHLNSLKDKRLNEDENLKKLHDEISELKMDLETKKSSCASLQDQNQQLQRQVETFKDLTHQTESLKLEVDKLSREHLEKDNTIRTSQNNIKNLKKEIEILRRSFETVSSEKQELKKVMKALRTEINNLSSTLLTDDWKRDDETLVQMIASLKIVSEQSKEKKSRIQSLEEQNKCLNDDLVKLRASNDSYSQRISNLENELSKLNVEAKRKNELEKRSCLLKQDVVRLKKDASELSNENATLRREITILRSTTEKITIEIAEKERLVNETRARNAELTMKLEQFEDQGHLKTELARLKGIIEQQNKTNKDNDMKETQSELKLQRQKQLFSSAQAQIEDLKQQLSDKEKIKCENNQYKMEVSLSKKRIEEYARIIDQLSLEKSLLSRNSTVSSCEEGCSEIKQNLKNVLCNIIEQIVNEQKMLLLTKHSQDERDQMKHILRDMKACHTILKVQLRLLRDQGKYDLDEVNEYVLKSRGVCNGYFTVEKDFIQQQVQSLEASNKAYLQEIMALRGAKAGGGVCAQCDSLKSEVSTLRQTIASQEAALTIVKNKNTLLAKENQDRMREVVGLQTQIYKEQDEKAKVAYTDYLKFCEDSSVRAQQEVKALEKHVRKLKDQLSKSEKTCASELKSVEVQCNLWQDESVLQEKYNKMKQVCVMRRQTNTQLQLEISRLKGMVAQNEGKT